MREKSNQKQENPNKGLRNNGLFFIIMSAWLLFFVYIGLQGGS